MKTRRLPRSVAAFVLMLISAFALDAFAGEPPHNVVPRNGYVPDAATAVRIAEAILIPIYGEGTIMSERPFSATLHDGVWVVMGRLPPHMVGGVAEVHIAKRDARVLRVTHGK